MQSRYQQFKEFKELSRLSTDWTPFGEVALIESIAAEERDDYCEVLYGEDGVAMFSKYKAWCQQFT